MGILRCVGTRISFLDVFMPVYLVFLQVAILLQPLCSSLHLAMHGPNLPASLETCKFTTGHRAQFFKVMFNINLFIERSLTKYLFLRAFGYQSIYSLRRVYTNDSIKDAKLK